MSSCLTTNILPKADGLSQDTKATSSVKPHPLVTSIFTFLSPLACWMRVVDLGHGGLSPDPLLTQQMHAGAEDPEFTRSLTSVSSCLVMEANEK